MNYLKRLSFNLLVVFFEISSLLGFISIFTHWWGPVTSVVVVGVSIGFVIALLRWHTVASRFHSQKPKLSSTTWAILLLIILSAVAGIQPLATVKDNIVLWVQDRTSDITVSAPTFNNSIVGKWQKLDKNNYASVLSPTLQFLGNGTVIIDDGRTVVTGTYKKLTDEYVQMTIKSDFFGMPLTGIETLRYQIENNQMTIRTAQGTATTYQRMD